MAATTDVADGDLTSVTFTLSSEMDCNKTFNCTHHPNYVYHSPIVIGLSIAIGILGIFSNGLAIVVIISSRSMRRRKSCTLIFNQSLADFGSSMALVAYSTIQTTLVTDDFKGHFLCEIWLSGGLFWGFLLVSTWNLMALTIERYLSVVYPVWHNNHVSHKRIKIAMVFIWIIPIGQSLIEATATTEIVNGNCKPYSKWSSEAARRVYGVILLIGYNILPLVCFLICYTKMALVIRAKAKKMTPSTTSESVGIISVPNNGNFHPEGSAGTTNPDKITEKENPWAAAKRNILITLVWVSVLYVVCWTPQGIYFFITNMTNSTDFVSDFHNIATSMLYFNCCVNPFIYLAKYNQFQISARKLFCSEKGPYINGARKRGRRGSSEENT